jgi:hypothetical protein
MKVVVVVRVEQFCSPFSLPARGSVYYKHDQESATEAVNIVAGDGTGESPSERAGRGLRQLYIGHDFARKWWYDKRDRLLVPRRLL